MVGHVGHETLTAEGKNRGMALSFQMVLAERLSRVSTGQSLLGTTLTCLREKGVRIARARLGLEVQHPSVLAVAWVYKVDTGLEEFLIRLSEAQAYAEKGVPVAIADGKYVASYMVTKMATHKTIGAQTYK